MLNNKNKIGDPTSKKKPKKHAVSTELLAPCSVFTQAIADEICARMAAGETLPQICRRYAHIPSESTVRGWMRNEKLAAFTEQYNVAHEALMDHWANETIDIADDGTNDWVEHEIKDPKGKVIGKELVLNSEHINRSRLRVDTRKWLLSKLSNKYGDKLDLNVGGQKNGAPIKHTMLVTADPVEASKAYSEMIEGT